MIMLASLLLYPWGAQLMRFRFGNRQIVCNAGHDGSIVLNRVLDGRDDFGFNAETLMYKNLFKTGVIDPTKVVRFALQNAASVTGLKLTTEAMITEVPKMLQRWFRIWRNHID